MVDRRLSRRRLMETAGAVIGASVLGAFVGACQPQVVEKVVEKPVEKVVTQVVEKEKVVEKPVEKVVTQVVEKEKVVVATAVPKPQVYKLTLATDWNAGARKDTLDFMKTNWEKKNENVKIEHWHMGSGGTSGPGGYTDVIVAMLLTGTAPDIIANFSWGPYVTYLADLTQDAARYGYRKEEVIFSEWNQMADGKLYGLGMNFAASGWIYNKTLFQEAGLKEPDDAWTLDTVLEVAQKLTNPAKKQYGLHLPHAAIFGWLDFVYASGAGKTGDNTAQLISDDLKKTRICEALGPDRFAWYVDGIYKYKVAPPPGEIAGFRSANISDPFASGRIGLKPYPTYNIGALSPQVGDRFQYAVMPIPRDPTTKRRAITWNADTFVVSKASQDRGTYDSAMKYVMSFFSDEVQKKVAELRPTVPTVKKWIESPEYTKAPPANMSLVAKTLQDKDVIYGDLQIRVKPWGQWWKAMNSEMDKAFTGDLDGRTAIANACKAGDEALAKAK